MTPRRRVCGDLHLGPCHCQHSGAREYGPSAMHWVYRASSPTPPGDAIASHDQAAVSTARVHSKQCPPQRAPPAILMERGAAS